MEFITKTVPESPVWKSGDEWHKVFVGVVQRAWPLRFLTENALHFAVVKMLPAEAWGD